MGRIRSLLIVGLFCLAGSTVYAQNKTLFYYNNHESELLPDAQTAFRDGEYDRVAELSEWYSYIVGDGRLDNLKDKAATCKQLFEEMLSLESRGQLDATISNAEAILAINPDDPKTESILKRVRNQKEESLYGHKGYMDIISVSFANSDKSGSIISDYGSTLYKDELKYLKPIIYYNGLSMESKSLDLYIKIFKPDGSLYTGSSSPSGYTRHQEITINPGKSNSYTFSGWGTNNGGYYSAGTNRFEIWYKGNKLYSTSVVIKEKENALSKGSWRSLMKKIGVNVTQSYDNGWYKGQTNDGQRDGMGVYRWNDGDYYWGRYSYNTKKGMGIYLVDNGSVPNCPNCKYFVGNYTNGNKSGTGTCYDKYGNLIYYGNFSDDKPTGTYPSPGNYSEYKFQCYEHTDGSIYIGETKNGGYEGYGIYIWSSGDAWFGPWENNLRNGYGLYLDDSGSFRFGKWNNNEYSQ